jgi:hypothetical protein
MPAPKKLFVEPTLREEASLEEVTLFTCDPFTGQGCGGGT